ncbi:MAG: diguanylate cyclase [Desulfobulbaceae bacterium]|nr:diguanylate cyclase [Desulfobulbaceae bacterium]
MKFGIDKKIVLGYLPLILVIFIIALLSARSLNELNTINKSIIEEDTVLVQIAGKMEEALLAQESYGRRFLILGSPQMLELFRQRKWQFEKLVHQVRELPEQGGVPIKQLAKSHTEFSALYTDSGDLPDSSPLNLSEDFDKQIKVKFDEIMTLLQVVVSIAKENQYQKMEKANSIGLQYFRITSLLSIMGIILGLAAASLITRSICRTINRLKRTTEIISEGRYDQFPQIDSHDELADLAGSIKVMAISLSKLEKLYLDSNPLTRMPGGSAIENSLLDRLKKDTPLAFCMLDLDNFKSYNDRYGFAKGNEVIKATALIIETALAKHGDKNDFAGHIGGDDFAIITSVDKYEMICNSIISRFDENIAFYYNETDRTRGHIVSKNRQGEEMLFPLMTISIGVVTNENIRKVNPIEMGKTAAELKEYAKSIPGSIFVTNRRENLNNGHYPSAQPT